MSLKFHPKGHKYESLNPEEKINWISVTTIISALKQPFDPITRSTKSSKNKRSKWYGMKPETIQKIWSDEGIRANTMGEWYHTQRENDFRGITSLERQGKDIPIFMPIIDGEYKMAPDQRLMEGIYPEHFMYLKSSGICGQSDRVDVIANTIDITDFKTNKKLRTEGYKNYEGVTQKMQFPVAHLDDCEMNYYALQLSIYMYIVHKHNPSMKAGKLFLQYAKFKKESEDKHGYPIYIKDYDGNFIVDETIIYELPYLRKEVRDIIQALDNKQINFKHGK